MSKSSDVTRRTAIHVAIAGAAAAAAGAARSPRQGAGDMERVQGIGGFFFRAKDPKKLAWWYEANLGVTSVPDNYDARLRDVGVPEEPRACSRPQAVDNDI